MRIFISEFVAGGGWPEPELEGSLAAEGRAMLTAIVADFAQLTDVRVTTTWDARLGKAPWSGVHTIPVESAVDELAIFRELSRLCDATLVIAPEFHGLLARRCQIAEAAGARLLGPGSSAVELCTDKLALCRHFERHGIPTIATESFQPRDQAARSTSIAFPAVIKPRDGAGSQSTYILRDAAELAQLSPALETDPLLAQAIWQPFVAGQAVSVAVLSGPHPEHRRVFPVAEQLQSDDGRLRYLGGRVPAPHVDARSIADVALQACAAVPGLNGYVGVDLVVPHASPERPLVVEINPRLTTSYIGYRRLTDTNLAECLLTPDHPPKITWRTASVTFKASGVVE